ncbi:NAD(P)-binding protein [Lophiostoma macrostomum CBS 122681]|uniref:D-xylose 1-dehydrogenase (NADP(+), D-xylono-1,5-lactone-forming) n=1 Tax=Lophiostoma macrostomum CBS 122681 TaxID=1314788 RepID=A0A6A6SV33_9PLEO|nr:NAD(P)-binding protein [Lophiostoma macrostomum CBS 122681]
MSSLLEFISRNRLSANPPEVPKSPDALKFGILGAANIALTSLIKPAKSHPEVVIQAVAARDKQKAIAYAKKHGIPDVKDDYEALLADPSITAVYIPLPASSHYAWALKSLSAGKHVLLEKPSVVNFTEATSLFRSPLLTQPNPPILLEAVHFLFQPTWHSFLSLLSPPAISHVTAVAKLPSYMIPGPGKGSIKFDYDMGGGNILDLGTYPLYAVRQIMRAEPDECVACKVRLPPPPHEGCLCDEAAHMRFVFPGNRTAEIATDLRASVTTMPTFRIAVVHGEVEIEVPVPGDSNDIPATQKRSRIRKVTLNNFLVAAAWHRIDIEDETLIRDRKTDRVVKRSVKKESRKVYTFKDAGVDQPSEAFWTSYRHQLEQFVNRVRGRAGSGLWVSGEESVAQAKMIDMAYEKSGLPLRRTSGFRLDA